MTDALKIALIVATPPTLAALGNIVTTILYRKQSKNEHLDTKQSVEQVGGVVAAIEKQTNSMLSKLKGERDAATSRADIIQGQATGAEQERTRSEDKKG